MPSRSTTCVRPAATRPPPAPTCAGGCSAPSGSCCSPSATSRRWGADRFASLLAEKQVDHPAAADVFARQPAVLDDLLVAATCLLQRVAQDRQVVEVPLVVDVV